MVPQHHAMFSLRQLLPALLPAAIVLSCLTVATQAGPADCVLNKVALARVVTQDARLHFIAGASKRSCPSAERACRLRAYLVPGDEVLVDAAEGPYVCVFFKSQRGPETRAWLPRAALQIAPPKAAPAPQWAGKWELEGKGRPRGQTLAIGYDPDRSGFPPGKDEPPDSCAAKLELYGRYLVVEDNHGCGGLNVSFTGTYV